jgi:hypothetical protein
MARSNRHQWTLANRLLAVFSRRVDRSAKTPISPLSRRQLRVEPLEDRRMLALVTVNTLGDTVDFNDGVTSLREAIFATNLIGGVDTINFDASLTSVGPATLTLTQGELKITDGLTIAGPGANLLTVDASGNDPTPDHNNGDGSRVFNIDERSIIYIDGSIENHGVSISGLTLTGGDAGLNGGGAILVRGELTVANCTISGNSATGGGGAIFGQSLTVINSTISGNSAEYGGGLATSLLVGELTLTGSTVSGNSASIHGGGLFGPSVIVNNSTISGNSAGANGGGICGAYDAFFGGGLTVTNSTIHGNSAGLDGGGIFKTQTAAPLSHTIIAGNTRGVGEANDVTGGATVTFSLLGVNTGASVTDNGGNLIGTSASPVDPKLGPLADNGGPTLTHALSADSPAINRGDLNAVAGVNGVPAFDQRGAPFGRIFGGRIDIGAFELQPMPAAFFGDYNQDGAADLADYIVWRKTLGQTVAQYSGADGSGDGVVDEQDFAVWRAYFGQTVPPPPGPSDLNLVVDTLADESDGNYTIGNLSLREALLLANTHPSVDTISFSPALTSAAPATILLTLGELAIADSLTINGPGANLLTIDASNNDPTPELDNGDGSRVFNISDGTGTLRTVRIHGLTLTGGDASPTGGAILSREDLTVSECTISGNSAVTNGGGIDATRLILHNSTIRDNAALSGGGILGGIVTIESSQILNNSIRTGGNSGGGVRATNATISGSTISGNSARRGGGGIVAPTITVTDSTISGNLAGDGHGGGIYHTGTGGQQVLIVSNCTISDNTAGGAFSVFEGGGGGIFSKGTVSVFDTLLSNNSGRHGGGISHFGSSTTSLTVVGSRILDNEATGPFSTVPTGGFYLAQTASGFGGGILNVNSDLTVTDTLISGNTARLNAGGILHTSPSYRTNNITRNVTITRSTISGNSALGVPEKTWYYGSGDGGGILAMRTNLAVTDSTISDNRAGNRGGGIVNYAGLLTVTGSAVVGNWTTGETTRSDSGPGGGGIASLATTWPEVTISNSTVARNSAQGNGGGMLISGGATISRSEIIDNFASGSGGGIESYRLEVVGSTIRGNSAGGAGGGIHLRGNNLNVDGTTISDNSAGGNGGGIHSFPTFGGTIALTGSTISGNASEGDGGGIYIGGTSNYGTLPQAVTISNVTLSDNSAQRNGGGAFLNPGAGATAALRHSTVAYNSAAMGGGAFLASGTLELTHTISAVNSAAIGPDLTGLFGAVVNASFNLIGNNAHSGLATSYVDLPDARGNIVGGTGYVVIDPMLGALADNGGQTKTHALLANSPAIDAGNTTAVSGIGNVPFSDQRGAPFERIFGGRIDIGAYERQSVPSPDLVVDTLNDEIDGDYSAGDLSLREAIGLAHGSVDNVESISFAPALTANGRATILLTHGELAIRTSIMINGPGAHLLTIDASGSDPTPEIDNGDGSRIFNIDDGRFDNLQIVDISDLTLTGGDVQGEGGGIHNLENLTVRSSVIIGNAAGEDGGGIYNGQFGGYFTGSRLAAIDSTISNNSAGLSTNSQHYGNGGGISSYNGVLEVSGSIISDNSAKRSGGGLLFWSAPGQPALIFNSTISGNSAAAGGGMYAAIGSLSIRHVTITANAAPDGHGSGLLVYSDTLTGDVYSSIIAGNSNSDLDIYYPASYAYFSSAGYNIVGSGSLTAIFNKSGDQVGVDPGLGPLADNGGHIMTHAPFPDSPALNAGSPSAVAGTAGVPAFDQRGAPFERVFGGLIDIGAFELQPIAPPLPGDYNQDGAIDSGDYVVWRKTFGSSVANYSVADGSGNGIIDQDDLTGWKAHFGQSIIPSAAVSAASVLALTVDQLLPAAIQPETATSSATKFESAVGTQRPATVARDLAFAGFEHRPMHAGHSAEPALPVNGRKPPQFGRPSDARKVLLSGLSFGTPDRYLLSQSLVIERTVLSRGSEAEETANADVFDFAFASTSTVLSKIGRIWANVFNV